MALCLAALLMTTSSAAAQRPTDDPAVLTGAIWDFPPFHSLRPDRPPTGFAIDVMDAVGRRAGFTVKYIIVASYDSARVALRDGRADFVPNVGILPSRAGMVEFTFPMQTIHISIFVRSGTSRIMGMEDLVGHPVGVVRGNIGVEILAASEGVISTEYGNIGSALTGLITGQVDAMIYPAPVAWTVATELGLQGLIQEAGEPLTEVNRGIVVLAGNSELLARLNSALADLLADREYSVLLRRWFADPPSFWTPGRLAAAGGVVLLLFGIGHYIRVARLNRSLVHAANLVEGSLHEKDLLLKEIHHRVKNNLQVMSSLQYLQAQASDDSAVRKAFEESRARVASMALVHEMLYQKDDLSSIDLGAYLHDLTRYLSEMYEADRQAISVETKGNWGIVDPDIAIPLGLIVTELVSNALKHAFPDGEGGAVFVESVTTGEGERRVTVRDTGVGFESDPSHANDGAAFGLNLVPMLAKQLGGSATRAAGPGTAWTIEIPSSPIRRAHA